MVMLSKYGHVVLITVILTNMLKKDYIKNMDSSVFHKLTRCFLLTFLKKFIYLDIPDFFRLKIYFPPVAELAFTISLWYLFK